MQRRLGSFESAQAITNEYYPFNVVTVLRLDNGPQAEVLREALAILRDRHPLLRARVTRDGGHLAFQFDQAGPIPLNLKSLRHDRDSLAVVENELNSGFDIASGPLLRMTALLSADEKVGVLVITAQHAIFDAVSGTHLIAELLGLCQILSDGDPVEGFESLPVTAAADEYFPQEFKGGRGVLRQARFIARQLADEVGYRWRCRGHNELPVVDAGRCRIISRVLSERHTKALARRCRERRVTVNGALCAAQLMVAVKQMPGQTALRNFVFANLRPYLQPSLGAEHLGSYFAALQVTIKVSPTVDFWSLARLIDRQVHAASKRGEKFTSVRLSQVLMRTLLKFRKFRMGCAALAYGGSSRLAEFHGNIRVTGLNAFVSNFVLGPPFTANARRFLGKIWWDMVYLDSDMDAELAEKVAESVVQRLVWVGSS